MCLKKRCCFCIPLKYGCLLIAVFDIVLTIIGLVHMSPHHIPKEHSWVIPTTYAIGAITIITCIIYVVFAVLVKHAPWATYMYMVVLALHAILALYFTVILITHHVHGKILIISGILQILIYVYCLWPIYSYMRRSTVIDDNDS